MFDDLFSGISEVFKSVVQPFRELTGEITGTNKTRKLLMDQQQALVEAKAARAKEIADENTRRAQQDLQASKNASPTANTALVLGSDVFDPLGTASQPLGTTSPANNATQQQTGRGAAVTPIQQVYERNFLGL